MGHYEISGTIGASARSIVQRGVRVEDGVEVVIKSAAPDVPPEDTRARYRNEWFIAGMFDSPCVARVVELVDELRDMSLVFEHDPDLRALDERIAGEPAPAAACVRVAIGLVDALAEIHAKSVVHRDVKPANLLVDAALTRVQLIDFGIATIVPRELGRRLANSTFAGTLGFMAPEQTGRVNRGVDYRSDYYGLGATMYWMLAGRHPFAGYGDASEILHAQLTRVPPLLSDVDARVPEPLARIIAKLLSNDADDRYQGSYGLRVDLARCLAQLGTAGEGATFELARVDPSERLLPPRTLHGRERERERLLGAHARASHAGPVVVLVRGPSGSGKSALVDELREQLLGTGGVLAACKFEQYGEASAHAGSAQLLRSLVEQLGAGAMPTEQLSARLREELGTNALLLTDLVPELDALLGPLDAPPSVGATQARDRFRDTLDRFIDVLLVDGLEFVLIVDDAQWADAASLSVLESLARSRRTSLTIVLTARDEALAGDHALPPMLASLDDAGVVLDEITLGPLSPADVRAFVEDVLAGSPDSAALAELLHRRTQGIPLFVAQLTSTLYAEGIIDMDRERGEWRVALERAAARESSGDVVEFLIGQFDALPRRARRLLGVAACIGARFELELLATAAGEPVQAIGATVWAAVASGHLLVVGEGGRAGAAESTSSISDSRAVAYAFAHDRVQQVAHEALDVDREDLHLTLARRLAARVTDPARVGGELLHALAGYIAEARARVTDVDERRRFAALCIEAGARAKAAAGFEAAATHLGHGLELLDGVAFDRAAKLDARLEHAECLVLSGAIEAGARAYRRARERVNSGLELARVLLSHVTMAMVPGDTELALDLTIEAAEAFDLDLRVGGDAAWFGAAMTRVMTQVEHIGHDRIVERPALADPQHACVCRMLLAATNAAYLAGDIHLYGALALAIIDIGLEHGVDDTTGVAFIQVAIILASGLGDYAATRRYAKLSERLLDRFPQSPLRGMFEVIRGSTIQPWVEAMAASIPRLERIHVRLRADGYLTNAGYASFTVVMNGYCIGASLPRVQADAARAIEYLETIGDRPLAHATLAYSVSASVLADASTFDDEPLLAGLDAEQLAQLNPAAYFVVHAVRAFTCLLLDDRDRTDAAIEAMGEAVAAGTGLIMWIVHKIVVLLRDCERWTAASADRREQLGAAIEAELEWLARWAASCPDNAACYLNLATGAWAQARGELELAQREYASAADRAAELDFHHVEGLASERGAAVALARGDRRLAAGFLAHARRSYTRWGARALELRVLELQRALGHEPAARSGQSTLGHSSSRIHALDVSSIVKMSLALSDTTSLSEVVAQLLVTASENAGADRGALLLERGGELELHAVHEVGAPTRSFDPPVALADAGALVVTSVILACEQRGAEIIVDDAQLERSDDPHVIREGLRSLLALPIDKRGEHIGVLYFENRVTPGAFTRQQLRVLNMLAAQAAVTLDSARLFDALREREAQWRALVDSAPDVILIVDRQHRVEFCNRPDALVEGREAGVVGRSIEEVFGDESRERVAATVDYVFATGQHGAFETTQTSADRPRRFTTRLGPIARDGVVERVTLISTDVSEQRELELQFRQAQKMQAIGTLAGGVAHDFNNLLTVILGACDLGQLDLTRLGLAEDTQVWRSLEEIGEAGERAAQLTRQLLAFSRKQVLQPEHFDLNVLIRELARMLTRLLGEPVELVLELGPEPCWLHADPGQLEQVVMNLAVNARDAMPDGGRLTIATAHRELRDDTDALAAGRYVALDVHDTGVGISPAVIRRVFEPFFTTKASGEGTGLGLSTVLGIVEQSGGHVDIDSELGRGTSFRALLPAAADPERTLDAGAELAELPHGSETVLVVEDDGPLRSLAVQMLEGLGYRVLEAADGDAAIHAARTHTPVDLVLADMILPGANGREVGLAVTRLHPGVKLLYTSGYIDEQLSADGEANFIHKPYNREQLARAVRRVLDEPGA